MEWKPLIIGDLKARVPIVQGGMGVGISLSRLAAAVAREGGIGIISTAQIGYREEEFDKNPIETNLRAIKKEVELARQHACGGIIGVNIMVATKNYQSYVKAAVEAGVDLIISGAGLPTSLPEWVAGSHTKIAPIVSSLKAATVICKLWDRKYKRVPDMVVIEGPKAGGHLGFTVEQLEQLDDAAFEEEIKEIITLVEQYSKKYGYHIPVIFGGGVYDKKDMEHYMALGIDGVQVATRFVTTEECDADERYKLAYIHAKKEDIRIVKSPVGMPGRAIYNEFMDKTTKEKCVLKQCHQCLERCDRAVIPYCITDALVNAAKGEIEHALLFCGKNAYRAAKIETVHEVMESFQ